MITVFEIDPYHNGTYRYYVRDEESYCFLNDFSKIDKGIPLSNMGTLLERSVALHYKEIFSFKGRLATFTFNQIPVEYRI